MVISTLILEINKSGTSPPSKPRWTHPKGSRLDVLENALAITLKYLEKELDRSNDAWVIGTDLVDFLRQAQVNPVQLKYSIGSW